MKWGKFKTLTGQSGNIFKPGDVFQLVLGVMVMFFAYVWGQRGFQEVNKALPKNLQEQADPVVQAQKEAQARTVY